MAKKADGTTTNTKVALFTTTMPLLEAMFIEIRTLSNKRPDGASSVAKVKIINRLLTDVREVVAGEPEAKYLELLDEAVVPQYSDIAILLSQFLAAMKAFRSRYTYQGVDYKVHWNTGK